MQKNFSLVGFKIFQDALVGFFAPLVRIMTHYGILWQNHCITCAKPYPTKAHNDFHLYSMYSYCNTPHEALWDKALQGFSLEKI